MISIPKETELEKLSKHIAKVLAQLEKISEGWASQKHAGKSIKSEYYLSVKTRLRKEIDELPDCSEEDKVLAKNGVYHLKS